MDKLIGISKPQDQLRQNRNLLLIIGGVSSVGGLLIWSSSPFIWSSTKNHTNILLRYFALLTGLTTGITSVVCGHQLQKVNPLIKAIETAERDDFLTQLAASQYRQEQQWNTMAVESAIAPGTAETKLAVSDTSQNELPTSQSSEPLEVEHFRSLYKSVSLLKQQQVSDTQIIETVFASGGRKFDQGKQMLETLLQLGQQQGW